ncbi:hypothetical protein MMC34_004666 [Xylographa carneopallida]|nr:hypothetical protein [Xylographa carneopallida]
MADDAAAIRAGILPLIEDGEEVVLVLDSAAGFLASDSIGGLGVAAREKEGMVFLAAPLPEAGFDHGLVKPPNFEYEGERMTCASPLTNLFHDLPAPEAARWAARLSFQPARGWDGVIRHTAWREIPSVYLVCEGDRVVPPALQRMFAAAAGSEVVSCGAGHMPMLSVPGTVVGCVRRGAGAVEGL